MIYALTLSKTTAMLLVPFLFSLLSRVVTGDFGPGFLNIILIGATFLVTWFYVIERSVRSYLEYEHMRKDYYILAKRFDVDVLRERIEREINGSVLSFDGDPDTVLQKKMCHFTYRIGDDAQPQQGTLFVHNGDLCIRRGELVEAL